MSEKIPLLFAPGIRGTYHETRGSYSTVLRVLGRAGFQAFFFQPNWNDPRPETWSDAMASSAATLAEELQAPEIALGGFSCGGLIAVLAAHKIAQKTTELNVTGVLACSMSPWFGSSWVHRAHQQPTSDLHEASESLNANLSELKLPFLEVPVQLYAGTDEIETVQDMHYEALRAWPNATSVRPPTGHNIFDYAYLRSIEKNAPLLAAAQYQEQPSSLNQLPLL